MQRLNRLAVVAVLVFGGCSRRPADDLIATQIKARFFSDPGVKLTDLSVSVNKGLVTLSGTVPSAGVQLQAFKLAMYTDGVVKVDDRMTIVAPPVAPAPPAPVVEPVRLRHEQPAVSGAPAPEEHPIQQEAPAEPVPELRPPGGPRTPANVRIGGLRTPLIAKTQPEPAPPAEAEVIYDPAIAIIAAGSDRARRPGGLLVTGPAAAASLFDRWFIDFNRIAPQAQLTYRASDSIDARAELTVTDLPSSAEQIPVSRRTVLQFPVAVGGVVLVSNLPGVTQEINFSGDILAAIFSGKITRWNDPALAALNPQTALPAAEILAVHRSDLAGTTFLLTDYLSKTAPSWRFGSGATINWPAGIGIESDEAVAALIRQTPNSLGYVELAFALQNRLPFGTLRNAAGRNVKASSSSLTAPAAAAYPIAGLTWLNVSDRIRDKARRDNITSFLNWMLTQGQRNTSQFGYAPLPQEIVIRELAQIGRIR